jgi:hypothetical protein
MPWETRFQLRVEQILENKNFVLKLIIKVLYN